MKFLITRMKVSQGAEQEKIKGKKMIFSDFEGQWS